jgi:hypothetical protein
MPPVRRAAVLLVTEAVAVLGFALVYAVGAVTGDALKPGGALVGGVMLAVFAGLIVLVARGVDDLRGWARSPAIVVQLLALPIGIGLAYARVWLAAVPVVLLAGAVLYQLATPEARIAFREADGRR